MQRSLAFAIAVLLVPLAGCMGGGKDASIAQVAPDDTNLAQGTTNSLQGFVLTSDLLPIPDALVSLLAAPDTRRTNEEGGFRFENLVTGDHTLVVTKEGYREGKALATVREGFASLVNVTLDPVPRQTHHTTIPFVGTVTCHATVGDDPETGTREDCGGFDATGSPMKEFEIDPGTAQIQIETFWIPATAAAKNLTIKVESVGLGALDVTFAYFAGTSGMKVTIGEANLQKYFPNGGKIRVTLSSGPSARVDGVPAGVGLAFEQSFEVDATFFFGTPGPSDFSYRA